MKQITFATGNDLKLRLAADTAKSYGIHVTGQALEIDEIQSEDAQKVIRDKAAKAFAIVKQPVVVSDDSWAFRALNGFPGVYMHSVNAWFTPEDFLRLMSGVKDRKVTLTQMIVYQDSSGQKLFAQETGGEILLAPSGTSPDSPNHTVTAMDGDGGLSIAEVYNREHLGDRRVSRVWQEFFEWYGQL